MPVVTSDDIFRCLGVVSDTPNNLLQSQSIQNSAKNRLSAPCYFNDKGSALLFNPPQTIP